MVGVGSTIEDAVNVEAAVAPEADSSGISIEKAVASDKANEEGTNDIAGPTRMKSPTADNLCRVF